MKLTYTIDRTDSLFFLSFYFSLFTAKTVKFVTAKASGSLLIFIVFYLLYSFLSNTMLLLIGMGICVGFFFVIDSALLTVLKKKLTGKTATQPPESVTVEIADGTIVNASATSQFSISATEMQCIYFHRDYLLVFFTKTSVVIIPRAKVADGDINAFQELLKMLFLENNPIDDIVNSNLYIAKRPFLPQFRQDFKVWLRESKRSAILSFIAVLIAFIIIGAYVLWLNLDFK